jgi:integrase
LGSKILGCVTAIFTGLRASELRGLTWDDVDLDRRVLTVRQRADRWNTIGSPKSDAGKREVPALTAYATKKGRSLVLAFWRSATDHSRRRAAPTHRTRLLYPTPLLSKAFGSTRRNDAGSPGAARRSTAKPQVFVHRRHDVRQST